MADGPAQIVIVRADAGPAYGIGHLMRCRSLVQALVGAGFSCHFACAEVAAPLRALLTREAMDVHIINAPRGSAEDARATLDLARSIGASVAVLDGYCFDASWRRRVSDGVLVLALDDLGTISPLYADIVLNAGPNAQDIDYARVAPGARLLLGPAYTLIRKEILDHRDRVPPLGDRRDWLVMMGGMDPLRLTLPLLQTMVERIAPDRGPRRIVAAIAGSHPDRAALERLKVRSGGFVHLSVDCFNQGEFMAQAGLAITAGGSTLGELAVLGVPSVVAVVADNQVPSARKMAASGLISWVDAREDGAEDKLVGQAQACWADFASREQLSFRLRNACDGGGAERVVQELDKAMKEFKHS